AEALRELLRQRSVLEICDYSAVKVFKEVAVYPIVFRASMDKGARSDPTMTVMSDLEEVLQTRDIPVQTFYADVSWDRYFGAEPASAILTKIMAHPPLQQQCKGVSAAATVSEAYELKKVILEKKEVTGKQFKKFVNTGTIDRFALCWAERPTRYIKGSYNAPVVLDADLRSINLKRLQQAAAPKIIIGGMTKELECALDPSGEYLAGKSTTIVLDDDLENLRYLLGVLNSKIVTFWYRHYYKSLSLAGGYLRINQGEIKTIPVPKSTPAVRRKLAHIVDQILAAKRNQSTSSKLEAELEEELSKMYGLTAEEMALVQDHQSNLINA
ncbi:MAG TPA: TaqI-like C-terminal specificity domain-containing protein, partial [Candidatus Acidoferrum sp.]